MPWRRRRAVNKAATSKNAAADVRNGTNDDPPIRVSDTQAAIVALRAPDDEGSRGIRLPLRYKAQPRPYLLTPNANPRDQLK